MCWSVGKQNYEFQSAPANCDMNARIEPIHCKTGQATLSLQSAEHGRVN